MSEVNSQFDQETTGQYGGYLDTVRGYVREEVARANLLPYIGHMKSRLEVLDIGGGEGRDALWLASMGHNVLLIDPSEEMIDKAEANLVGKNIRGSVDPVCGDPAAVLSTMRNRYDVILSHGVLMYLDNPQQHIDLLGDKVKSTGVVSLMTKGRHGAVSQLFNEQRPSEAQKLMKSGQFVNHLGRHVQTVTPEAVEDFLRHTQELGKTALGIVDWFGVRIMTDGDYRRTVTVEIDELKAIRQEEITRSRDESTKGMGQMLQFILRHMPPEKTKVTR